MSDTPRTDAETCRDEMDHVDTDFGPFAPSDTVPADFAREIERELEEAQAKLRWFMQNQNQIAMDVIRPVEEENARLRQLEREVHQCKEIVWQAALAQSGRCGITERLLLRLYNDMERACPAPDTKTP
jgi:hypothetical protein